ncbi:MAG: VTC domain-containing protein [Planctomycetota bacterium]
MTSPPRTGPRLELKCTAPSDAVRSLVDWLGENLRPDPHARDPELPEIRIESIYFDTLQRDCYRDRSRHQLPKHRVRRYDGGRAWILEEKLRVGSRVWKRRLPIEEPALVTLLDPERDSSPISPPGLDWFRSRFRMLGLLPTLQVSYDRLAWIGPDGERVTIDRRLEVAIPRDGGRDGAALGFAADRSRQAVPHEAIIEFKGPEEETPLLAAARAHLALPLRASSKYSPGLEAGGLEVAAAPRTPSGEGSPRR